MFQGELCTVCHKRIASVFISKMDEQGNQVNEGICLVCAKKMGLPQVTQFLDRMGISDEDLESITDDMGGMLDSLQNMENEDDSAPAEEEAKDSGTNTPNIFQFLKNLGPSSGIQPVDPKEREKTEESTDLGTKKKGKNAERETEKLKFLSQYGTNLNDKAKAGDIDHVVGREKEIDRVIQILNRRTKNNPVLIGEPGVGKTAIAEAIALKITQQTVPHKLLRYKIYLLDLTAMVAGTQFRGQFEARMKGVLDEVKKAGNIVLVIDEVHNIMGAGEAEGSLNAANILKPALSRGEIQVIGATTLKEYRKYIEKDGALERRFQPVFVEEPSVEETIQILQGIKSHYEGFHKVHISDALIRDLVRMSERYITDRFLPDKAIDVLDEAASRANLRNQVLVEIEMLENELEDNREEQEKLTTASENVSEETEEGNNKKIELFKLLAEYKSKEAVLLKKLAEKKEHEFVDIIFNDLAAVIENWTGIPVQTVSEEEAEKLLQLEERLNKKVIGQSEGVAALSKAIRRNRSGFRKRMKPSSFIFVGPTGVGKTELAKQLALELFGNAEALVRLDMSEYMEKHTVSKLIGSPPGYVGYDDAGQLTEQIRRRPYSVILMDEIEKAHADVFNMLLQILDDGRLTDSQGRTVNFENTIIIMTSNAGNSIKGIGIGFSGNKQESAEQHSSEALKKIFRPEFLNRVDEVIVFKSLDMESMRTIAKIMLQDVIEQCTDKGIAISVHDDVIVYLAENGYHEIYGARPLRRFIQKSIEDELSDLFLRGRLPVGSSAEVVMENGVPKINCIE